MTYVIVKFDLTGAKLTGYGLTINCQRKCVHMFMLTTNAEILLGGTL